LDDVFMSEDYASVWEKNTILNDTLS
jgi:hypothetical protein